MALQAVHKGGWVSGHHALRGPVSGNPDKDPASQANVTTTDRPVRIPVAEDKRICGRYAQAEALLHGDH